MTKLPTLSMYFHFKSTNSLWDSVNRSLFKWRGWGDNVSVTQTAKKENISFSKKKVEDRNMERWEEGGWWKLATGTKRPESWGCHLDEGLYLQLGL